MTFSTEQSGRDFFSPTFWAQKTQHIMCWFNNYRVGRITIVILLLGGVLNYSKVLTAFSCSLFFMPNEISSKLDFWAQKKA
ncbi:MAG: hypothetical protein ACKVLH_07570 [Bacteroidia bacterium]|jgi:hypothetical protein